MVGQDDAQALVADVFFDLIREHVAESLSGPRRRQREVPRVHDQAWTRQQVF